MLVAPPGAGKTTRAPLALMDEPWAKTGKLILLEPRRLAARAAAQRMADTLGESVGETIGLRVRMESRVSARTRIEVVTEGVFARMILEDAALEGVSGVIFDEFHERSLDADAGLALALDAQQGLRADLRLLVMSATLEGARVAALLGDAPIIESLGRAFPVVTHYLSRDPRARIEDEIVRVTMQALRAQPGSLLVFLPGQGEILRTAEKLREHLRDAAFDIAPLYGAMDRRAQDLAVSPSAAGRRKIVLATSIAETSLTIEGIRVVIDCGLTRAPRYEPDLGLTRLETVRVSRAAADQRRGRAGRTQPGVCYRLWEEAATGSLEAYARPEILDADLSGLLLDLAAWGVRDPAALRWLDAPPAPAVKEARARLAELGALGADGAITDEGRAIRELPLPPRLARMVVEAGRRGMAATAARIAVVLSERGVGGASTDIAARLDQLQRDRGSRSDDARRLATAWQRAAQVSVQAAAASQAAPLSVGGLLALAYPDRVAKARGKPGEFLMANGRAARLDAHDALARCSWLAVAEVAGRAAASRILAAAAIEPAEVAAMAGVEMREETWFDKTAAALRTRRVRKLGALVLAEQTLPTPASPLTSAQLADGVAGLGAARWPWTKELSQWRDRVMFLRRAGEAQWPDVSDAVLEATARHWLAPYLDGKTSLAAISNDDLEQALHTLLPWQLQRRLETDAPTHFTAPTGNAIALDYAAEGGPALAIRVQELYGLSRHPAIAGGRAPLTLHLLSPAHRPIQITRDLPGFWAGSWAGVKADMKGRYPRHVWPDDPANAAPTARAKPRGT